LTLLIIDNSIGGIFFSGVVSDEPQILEVTADFEIASKRIERTSTAIPS
jgi:hypothetical protein